MPITEQTSQRLVLTSGSTTLTLDKDAAKATLQRKLLFFSLKPLEQPLADIVDVTLDAAIDRASSVEICHTMLVNRAGGRWVLAADDKNDAIATIATVRAFLGLPAASA